MISVSFISLSHPPPIKFYFLTTKYFQIIYFICSSIVRQSVSSSYCRYHSLSPPLLNKIFGSYFLVFGKCEVTQHRLYRGSLTLLFYKCLILYFSENRKLTETAMRGALENSCPKICCQNPWIYLWKSSLFSKAAGCTTQKWSFPLRISSVNATISADSCGFGHIYWRNP